MEVWEEREVFMIIDRTIIYRTIKQGKFVYSWEIENPHWDIFER